jgi:hypothetical protein
LDVDQTLETRKQIPEAWVGLDVVLGIAGGNQGIVGRLDDVNDRGIVLFRPDEAYGPIFYPWSAILYIRPPRSS